MKTIEENAKQLAAECDAAHDEFGAGYRKGLEDGYIIGAHKYDSIAYLRGRNDALKEMAEVIEQKEREVIEKAVSWLKATAYKYIVDIGIKDEDLVIGDMCWVDFRKAMEE